MHSHRVVKDNDSGLPFSVMEHGSNFSSKSVEGMSGQLKQGIIWGMAILFAHTAAFFPVWESLVHAWSQSEDYSHAFLIVPLCVYLVWMKKEILREVEIEPSWFGLAITILSTLTYIIGAYAGVLTLNAIALVISILGAVYAGLGAKVVKVIGFPLFFLFLMIPIPSQLYWSLTTPLQLLVSKASVYLLQLLTDIPILREGNVIHLPEKTLQVVAACSGMRSIISLTTLSVFFGYISLRRVASVIVLTASALPIAIIINILRIIIMVVASYSFHYELSFGAPHTYLGLFVFGVAIMLTILCQKVLAGIER